MTCPDTPDTPRGEIVVYRAEDGGSRIRVLLEDETVWLTQRLMSDLYQVGVGTMNYHIKGVYEDGELSPEATIRQYRIVQTEGSRQVERLVDHYSLDMILAVGYRVRSPRGVQFRQWATERLREYLVKGFTLDDDRLKGRDGPSAPRRKRLTAAHSGGMCTLGGLRKPEIADPVFRLVC